MSIRNITPALRIGQRTTRTREIQLVEADGSTPLDLTNAESVTLTLNHYEFGYTAVQDGECTVVSPTEGIVEYTFTQQDTSLHGRYLVQFEVDYGTESELVPTDANEWVIDIGRRQPKYQPLEVPRITAEEGIFDHVRADTVDIGSATIEEVVGDPNIGSISIDGLDVDMLSGGIVGTRGPLTRLDGPDLQINEHGELGWVDPSTGGFVDGSDHDHSVTGSGGDTLRPANVGTDADPVADVRAENVRGDDIESPLPLRDAGNDSGMQRVAGEQRNHLQSVHGGGNKCVVSWTFDDGSLDVYDYRQNFVDAGIPFSLAIIGNRPGDTSLSGNMSWAQIDDLVENYDAEIGNHTQTHENLETLTMEGARSTVYDGHVTLMNRGYDPEWFVYPQNSSPTYGRKIVSELYGYAFVGSNKIILDNETAFRVPRVDPQSGRPIQEIKNEIDAAAAAGTGIVLVGHTIVDGTVADEGQGEVSTAKLAEIGQYVQDHVDAEWGHASETMQHAKKPITIKDDHGSGMQIHGAVRENIASGYAKTISDGDGNSILTMAEGRYWEFRPNGDLREYLPAGSRKSLFDSSGAEIQTLRENGNWAMRPSGDHIVDPGGELREDMAASKTKTVRDSAGDIILLMRESGSWDISPNGGLTTTLNGFSRLNLMGNTLAIFDSDGGGSASARITGAGFDFAGNPAQNVDTDGATPADTSTAAAWEEVDGEDGNTYYRPLYQ